MEEGWRGLGGGPGGRFSACRGRGEWADLGQEDLYFALGDGRRPPTWRLLTGEKLPALYP